METKKAKNKNKRKLNKNDNNIKKYKKSDYVNNEKKMSMPNE